MANYLTDYKAGYLLNALVTNPNAAFFPWNCADFPSATYPNGIPRASVLSAYNAKAGADQTKGANFAVLYAPGIASPQWTGGYSGSEAQLQVAVPGGLQPAPQTYMPLTPGFVQENVNEPIITAASQVS